MIVAAAGELLLLRAVGQHRPDIAASAQRPLKDNVAAIGSPAREVVAAGLVGELDPALAGHLHDVDVLPAGSSGAVLAVPTKGEKVAGR